MNIARGRFLCRFADHFVAIVMLCVTTYLIILWFQSWCRGEGEGRGGGERGRGEGEGRGGGRMCRGECGKMFFFLQVTEAQLMFDRNTNRHRGM